MNAVLVGVGLAILALVLSRWKGLRTEGDILVAVLRAMVQLSLVALLIGAAFEHLGIAALFVLAMLTAATITTGRRLKTVPGHFLIAAGAILAGSAPAIVPLLTLGGYGFDPRFAIPISGIVIGGAMTVTSLAGTHVVNELVGKAPEVEARLALGVSAAAAMRPYVTSSVRTALIPAIDQTKNVGIITLPGAFVGMILGGASPVEAAMLQFTVLAALLGAETMAGFVGARLVARAFTGPGERLVLPAAAVSQA